MTLVCGFSLRVKSQIFQCTFRNKKREIKFGLLLKGLEK